jgi:ABC-2 type transport system permease protein
MAAGQEAIASSAAPSLQTLRRPSSSTQRNLNLLRELALTQFKLKYTGSALGYLWSMVKPLMLFAIMYAIFVRLLKVTAPDFPVQLLVGIVLWNFFTESTSVAIGSIAGAGNLIRKASFPRWILVTSSTGTALMTFLINMALVVVVAVPIGHMHLSLRSLAAPLFILQLIVLIIGISLLLSAVFVFYRDIGHVWEILSLVLFYGSAVVYPFTILLKNHQNHLLATLAGVNPIAQVVEDLRHALVTSSAPWMASVLGGLYAIPLAVTGGIFLLGCVVFRRASPRFAENL